MSKNDHAADAEQGTGSALSMSLAKLVGSAGFTVQTNSELDQPSLLARLEPVSHILFTSLCLDTRVLEPSQAYVLLKSHAADAQAKAAEFAKQAQDKGAAFILSEVDLSATDLSVHWAYDPKLRSYLGSLKRAELELKGAAKLPPVVAVTGTNGKTSVATLSAELFSLLGYNVGLLGTAGNGLYPKLNPSSHTTQSVFDLHDKLAELTQLGAELICLEASSHGLDQGRMQAVPVHTAVFTNLSHDHLDYHGSMEHYANAKAKLFEFHSLKTAVINAEDPYASFMQTKPSCSRVTYSTKLATDLYCSELELTPSGIQGTLSLFGQTLKLSTPLFGRFNAANLLAVIGTALSLRGAGLEFDWEQLQTAVSSLKGAKGRMEPVTHPYATDMQFIVDYAHTPDALTQVIEALRQHTDAQIGVVFGCGGDRDPSKRQPMTKAALAADWVVATSDNPRSEDPAQILDAMLAGLSPAELSKIQRIDDRAEAIFHAVKRTKAKGITLIAGKGHETYQETKGVRVHFDDGEQVQAALQLRFSSNH